MHGSTYNTITTMPVVGSGSITSKHTEPLIGMVTESGTKFGADSAKSNRNSPKKRTRFTFGFESIRTEQPHPHKPLA